jgi:GNAT superfamily N-acetyltransferase
LSVTTFRDAREDDLPRVGVLWVELNRYHRTLGLDFPEPADPAAAWVDSFARTLGRFSFLWLAEQEAELVGFLLARLKRAPAYLGGVMVGEISDLYVSESVRSAGVARQLVEQAEAELRGHKVHSIEVQIMARNEGGHAFWGKMGYPDDLTQVRKTFAP